MNLKEAKSTFTLPDLLQGTKDVLPDLYKSALSSPPKVTGFSVEESVLMKMIKYSGQCDGYNPIITFYDYIKKEKPPAAASALSFMLGVNKMEPDVNQDDNVVRVSCTCNTYMAYFGQANYAASCHHGVKPKKVDGRDLGLNSQSPNKLEIPGMCDHLIGLYKYLLNLGKLA